MAEIHAPGGPLPIIPDNLTVPQFIFDYKHVCRPTRGANIPWFIDDMTGRKVGEDELRTRTYGLANALSSKYGIHEDDVVLVYSRNHIDYPVVIWAVHRLGGIISGANPDYTADELLYQLQESKATTMIVSQESLDIALAAGRGAGIEPSRIILFSDASAASSARADSHNDTLDSLVEQGLRERPSFVERTLGAGEAKTKLAFLSFSSGTTGKPKAVAIPHYSFMANVIQTAAHQKVNQNYCAWEDQRYRPGDIAILVLPLYHIYGLLLNLHFILFAAMSIVVVPKFNFLNMLNSIVRHKISHLMLVPPQVVLLCKHAAVKDFDLKKHVRLILCGAAPLSFELSDQLFKMFPDAHIGQAHGMTETCTATTMFPIETKRGIPGSAGQLLPGITARVVKDDGSLAGFDEPGELVIKTPSAALRYANNEKATRETFVDGWVRTGDEVKIDKNSVIWVLDRLKEIMKVRGFQVAPAELEGCILGHNDVSNACVVGIPDDFSGEVPLAFVVLTPDAADRVKQNPKAAEQVKASIVKHVADNKIKYKHLTGGVEFIATIPISPSGKLLRRILRDQAKELVKVKIRSKL